MTKLYVRLQQPQLQILRTSGVNWIGRSLVGRMLAPECVVSALSESRLVSRFAIRRTMARSTAIVSYQPGQMADMHVFLKELLNAPKEFSKLNHLCVLTTASVLQSILNHATAV
jgi:hypothetical protein